jgi:hypothetical protein
VRRLALAAALCVLAPACAGGGGETLTVYLPQRLGPEGPPGQITPVLTPVERERRAGMAAPWQAVLELRVGPSPEERAHGFSAALGPATRLRQMRVTGTTVTVTLAGKEPDYLQSAAIVLSLTELGGIEAVRLRIDGAPCCFYTHRRGPVDRTTRRALRGWTGEPCHLRARPDAVRCRRDE